MKHTISFKKEELEFLEDIETLTVDQWEEKYKERFNEPLPNDDMYFITLVEHKDYQVNLLSQVPYTNTFGEFKGCNTLEIIDKDTDEVTENIPVTTKEIQNKTEFDICRKGTDTASWFKIRLKTA